MVTVESSPPGLILFELNESIDEGGDDEGVFKWKKKQKKNEKMLPFNLQQFVPPNGPL